MAFERISEEELASVGVEMLDDLPSLEPDAMKAKFEETAKKLIAPKFNKLAEQLEAETGAGSIGAQIPDGLPEDTAKTVQAVLIALMIYVQTHEEKQDNPHNVNAEQVGAYTKAQTDKVIDEKVVEIGAGDMSMSVYDPGAKRLPIYTEIENAERRMEEKNGQKMETSLYDPQGKNQDIFAYGTHLYKATFLLDGWSEESPYTQTVAVQPVDGGPGITYGSLMTSPVYFDDTVQGEAQEALQEAVSLVNSGRKTFGYGTITCVIQGEKPMADAEVYFNARKGGV